MPCSPPQPFKWCYQFPLIKNKVGCREVWLLIQYDTDWCGRAMIWTQAIWLWRDICVNTPLSFLPPARNTQNTLGHVHFLERGQFKYQSFRRLVQKVPRGRLCCGGESKRKRPHSMGKGKLLLKEPRISLLGASPWWQPSLALYHGRR